MSSLSLLLLVCLSSFASLLFADVPVHCLYEDYYGEWQYHLGASGQDNTIDCKSAFSVQLTFTIDLKYPDVALDKSGNSGFWTRIYDEGVEVVLDGKKYFAFSYYNSTGYDCSKTMQGWYHDADGSNWGCYYATKAGSSSAPIDLIKGQRSISDYVLPEYHPHFENSKSLPETFELPPRWDWRNINGVNYVSPVRDQGHCGSCYSFATMAMFESRIRIMTENARQPVLSPQNIVSCSEYSQGCDGGFPYLVAKYGEDFQFFLDSCLPYTASDTGCIPCDLEKNQIYKSTGYYYVGGYYGACSAEEMRMEIYINGPVVVGFEVYDDFYSYTSGVYVHNTTYARPQTNPWEVTNHAVLVVGWGVDSYGVEYWIVKNSWGTDFGLDGFFNIRRNTDECGIESMAMAATPVIPN